MQRNKAPGPDDISAEQLKCVDDTNQHTILELINKWWNTGTIDEELELANIISIFKKGGTAEIANFRPIALLSVIYKTYAAIIRHRLSLAIYRHLWKTQYGFRVARSTLQPIHSIRCLMDFHEAAGTRILVTLLDWEKAFGKVDQTKLIEALERLPIPETTRRYQLNVQIRDSDQQMR